MEIMTTETDPMNGTRRAVCGKTASTVRRGGEGASRETDNCGLLIPCRSFSLLYPDNSKNSMEPNLFYEGEGYQDWTKVNPARSGRDQNDDRSSHRHGVVCGHGMSEQVGVLREEICAGGRHSPTAGSSGNPARPVWPGQKSERPVVAMKRLITVERRSLTWSK